MPVLISMLRGVNLGAHNRIKMDELRALYESLKFEGAKTYVQSGNVVFRTKETNVEKVAKKIRAGIEKKFGFSPEVIVRSTDEMRKAIAASPFAGRDLEPGRVLVTFLAGEPEREALEKFLGMKGYPEEVHVKGRELYIYFPNGAGKSKLPWSQVERLLKVTGTARNWNSVVALLKMGEEMEG